MNHKNKKLHVNEDLKFQIKEKKNYSEPRLIVLGSMQKVTLGGSNITADSGQGTGTGPNI